MCTSVPFVSRRLVSANPLEKTSCCVGSAIPENIKILSGTLNDYFKKHNGKKKCSYKNNQNEQKNKLISLELQFAGITANCPTWISPVALNRKHAIFDFML